MWNANVECMMQPCRAEPCRALPAVEYQLAGYRGTLDMTLSILNLKWSCGSDVWKYRMDKLTKTNAQSPRVACEDSIMAHDFDRVCCAVTMSSQHMYPAYLKSAEMVRCGTLALRAGRLLVREGNAGQHARTSIQNARSRQGLRVETRLLQAAPSMSHARLHHNTKGTLSQPRPCLRW
jgi:hypothetical protein